MIKVLSYTKEPDIKLLMRSHGTMYIPTEFVVNEPKIITPKMARYYSTSTWLLKDKVVDYKELSRDKDFNGTRFYDSIYLVEHWENYGADGHVDYILCGWAFMCLDFPCDFSKVNEMISRFTMTNNID